MSLHQFRLGIRIRQENLVRALRMVFLRNALHSFITGGTDPIDPARKDDRASERNRAPNETSKIQKTQTAEPTSARRSSKIFSITEYSEGIRICACLHPRPSGRPAGRRVARTHRSRAARGAPSLSPPARRGGETAARGPALAKISPGALYQRRDVRRRRFRVCVTMEGGRRMAPRRNPQGAPHERRDDDPGRRRKKKKKKRATRRPSPPRRLGVS